MTRATVIIPLRERWRDMIEMRESTHGDCTTVEMAGKLDASTTPTAQARLIEIVQEGKKHLALDFGPVTYLASSGLRMLLVVVREVQRLEGKLVLYGLSQTMLDTLDVTGFLPYFQTAVTRGEALSLLAP